MFGFGASDEEREVAREVEEERAQAWVYVRSLGRGHYVWRGSVLRYGLPLGLALAAVNTAAGGTYNDYNPVRLLAEGYFYSAGAVLISYLNARYEWWRYERIHVKRFHTRVID